MSKSENFDHEQIEVLWHVVAFIARRGDSKPLAEFLRRHAGKHDSIDYKRLADLIEGRLRKPRGRPSQKIVDKRKGDLYLRAADGDTALLAAQLRQHRYDVTVPDLGLLADMLEAKRGRGQPQKSKIYAGVQAAEIAQTVEDVRATHSVSLEQACMIVGEAINKSPHLVKMRHQQGIQTIRLMPIEDDGSE